MPFPYAVSACRILDLGSGAGRDSFLLGGLAGPKGSVVGLDMTPAMLAKAKAMIDYHAQQFGFDNVRFEQGELEKLDQVDALKPQSFDVVM